MRAPLIQILIKGFQTHAPKFIFEVIVSSLASLLVMALFSHGSNMSPAQAPKEDEAQLSALSATLSPTSASAEATDDFLQQVALSHVASLHPQSRPSSSGNMAVAAETGIAHTLVEPKRERLVTSKVRFAASQPKILPVTKPAEMSAVAAPPAPTPEKTEPALTTTAPATSPVKDATNAPLDFGLRVVNRIGTILSDSKTQVFETVAWAGNSLTSFAKKL